MADEHVVRLREDAEGWREVDGPRLTPDDPFLTGLDEARAAALVRSNWALERADVDDAEAFYGAAEPPFGPGEHTVEELRDELDGSDYSDAELDALADAEAAGKGRETALEAIGDAREA
jgi:hypothetical protein